MLVRISDMFARVDVSSLTSSNYLGLGDFTLTSCVLMISALFGSTFGNVILTFV